VADMEYELVFIQFSFILQQSNMSAIYKYLGVIASSMFWFAGPVTGFDLQLHIMQ
jgi:maltose/moltooligosaccharide transporter